VRGGEAELEHGFGAYCGFVPGAAAGERVARDRRRRGNGELAGEAAFVGVEQLVREHFAALADEAGSGVGHAIGEPACEGEGSSMSDGKGAKAVAIGRGLAAEAGAVFRGVRGSGINAFPRGDDKLSAVRMREGEARDLIGDKDFDDGSELGRGGVGDGEPGDGAGEHLIACATDLQEQVCERDFRTCSEGDAAGEHAGGGGGEVEASAEVILQR